MKYATILLIVCCLFGCGQETSSPTKPSSIIPQMHIEDNMLQRAGLPVNPFDKQDWVAKKSYQETDQLIQAFLSENKNKLTKEEDETINRAASRFMLDDMKLLNTTDHAKIKQYLTAYIKVGGHDAPLIWRGMQIAKKNAYWDAEVEAQANWFINGLIDATIQRYLKQIEENKTTMAQKPVYKALLTADNDDMAKRLVVYKAIKVQVAGLIQRKPASMQTFMESTN